MTSITEAANLRSKFFKSAFLLTSGQFVGYGLSFVRNLILARLLTKADFGLASAMSMTITLLELVSRMAFGKQIIQDKEGEDPLYQKVAQSVQLLSGLISASLVIAAAYPMALAFRVPHYTWVFACLAVVPISRGFIHLDIFRLQRQYNYRPAVLSEVLPQVLATAAAWPLAVWFNDFRAVLWIMLGKEFMTVILSHFFALRPYRFAWNRIYLDHMLAFGWPLLLNGLVMFASQQGDQMLVGAAFSMTDLAVYSVAYTIPNIAFTIFAQVGSSLMLPAMARLQSSPVEFEQNYANCLEIAVLGTVFVLGPLVVMGDTIIRLIYGSKYADVGVLISIFAIIVALRFFRWAPAVAAMSRADTKNQLFGNLGRAVSLPTAIMFLQLDIKTMAAIASCGIIGEIFSIIIAVVRVKRKQFIAYTVHYRPICFLLSWITLGVALHYLYRDIVLIYVHILKVLMLYFCGAILACFLFNNHRSFFIQKIGTTKR